jgi:predicted ATP-dependent protease
VVQAVRDGKFHIYAVGQIDEALELLSGQPAGKRLPDGAFPPDSVNGKAAATLRRLMETAKELMKEEKGEKKD